MANPRSGPLNQGLGVAQPTGNSADSARATEGLAKGGTSDATSHPAPIESGVGAEPDTPRADRERDATAEFAQSQDGREKTTDVGGSPHVGVGRRTARYENDPGQ